MDLSQKLSEFKNNKLSFITKTLLTIIIFIILLYQDDNYSAFIPNGRFYELYDSFIPIFFIMILLYLQYKNFHIFFRMNNTLVKKLLNIVANMVLAVYIIVVIYYTSGIFASLFNQEYTRKTYKINITKFNDYGKGSCKRSIKTDFINKITPKTIYTKAIKKYDLFRLCMDYNTFRKINNDKVLTIQVLESPIWGTYVKKLNK